MIKLPTLLILQNTPQRTPKPVLEATPSQPFKDAPNKAIREEELCSSEYTTCPPSVISVGSVDGKDAELHSPVTSPHSSTSGNISDLSDSSFNISVFLGEKTDNSKKMPPKDETQGHDEDQGHLEKQGQVGLVFTNGEAKENVEPLNWNNNNNNSTRRIQNIDEHIPESDSQLNQGSNHSSTSCSQQSGESTKPAETYISLIAKVIPISENFHSKGRITLRTLKGTLTVADLRGRPLNFMQFLENLAKSYVGAPEGWRHLILGFLDLPLMEIVDIESCIQHNGYENLLFKFNGKVTALCFENETGNELIRIFCKMNRTHKGPFTLGDNDTEFLCR